MNYADTLRVMMESYPTLFVDETDALHHLFFVLGSGYAWKGGELVDVFAESHDPDVLIREARARIRAELVLDQDDEARRYAGTSPDLRGAHEVLARTHRERFARFDAGPEAERTYEREWRARCIADGLDDCWFLLPDGRIGLVPYPLSDYACIFVPDDVKPDWLAAARKALELARSELFRRTPNDEEWLERAAAHLGRRP